MIKELIEDMKELKKDIQNNEEWNNIETETALGLEVYFINPIVRKLGMMVDYKALYKEMKTFVDGACQHASLRCFMDANKENPELKKANLRMYNALNIIRNTMISLEAEYHQDKFEKDTRKQPKDINIL